MIRFLPHASVTLSIGPLWRQDARSAHFIFLYMPPFPFEAFDIKGIRELNYIKEQKGGLKIGATTTLSDIHGSRPHSPEREGGDRRSEGQ